MRIWTERRSRCGALAAGFVTGLGVVLMVSVVQAADPDSPESAAGGDVGSARVHQVSQKDKRFAPGEITVEVGDEVVFLNDDGISHNVFSRSEDSKFNLKIQRPGEHKRYRFQSPGKSVVRCAIHPKMKLKVKVVQSEAAAAETRPLREPAAEASPGKTAAAPAEVAP